jgi:uncharacterized protein (DUF1499 family)
MSIQRKKIAMLLFFLLPLAVIASGQLGLFSGKAPDDLGLHDGMLKAPGPNSVNVVSSYATRQVSTAYNAIEPIHFNGESEAAFDKLKRVVGAMDDATIIKSEPTYVYAQYRTPLMKFVDDVEFVLDAPNHAIQMRSASRIGRSDLGANRKRLEAIRSLFNS